jgi:ABC-type siderophore export system fused ATPase/permease subunit
LLNAFKSFEVLALFIDTPLHHIFVTTPAVILGQVCVTKVTLLEKADPINTIRTVEFKPFCPSVWERDSLFFFDGTGVDNDQGSFKIKLGI